jgi:hypothetical protein
MLVRTKAKARLRSDWRPRARLFRRRGAVSFGEGFQGFQLPGFGFGEMEFDWGHDGIRKTMMVRDGWVHGSFEYDLRGRSLLALPVFYPLAAAFVRVETRRQARWGVDEDWTSHPDPSGWGRYPPPDADSGGAGVREPRPPRPSADGASTEQPLPDG